MHARNDEIFGGRLQTPLVVDRKPAAWLHLCFQYCMQMQDRIEARTGSGCWNVGGICGG